MYAFDILMTVTYHLPNKFVGDDLRRLYNDYMETTEARWARQSLSTGQQFTIEQLREEYAVVRPLCFLCQSGGKTPSNKCLKTSPNWITELLYVKMYYFF